MKRLLAFAVALVLIGFGAVAYAVDDGARSGNQEQGLVVKSWKGEYVGTSKHAVLDSSTGKIVFIVVSLGQEGNKEIAVPMGLFSLDRKNEALVLNISKKELDSAPEFHLSDLEDPEFAKKVYRFFAIGVPRDEETPVSVL